MYTRGFLGERVGAMGNKLRSSFKVKVTNIFCAAILVLALFPTTGMATTTAGNDGAQQAASANADASSDSAAAEAALPGSATDDSSIHTAVTEVKTPETNPTSVSALGNGLALTTEVAWDDAGHADGNWGATDTLTVSGIAAAKDALAKSGENVSSSTVEVQMIVANEYSIDAVGFASSFTPREEALEAQGVAASYATDRVVYQDDGTLKTVSTDTSGSYARVVFSFDFANASEGVDSASVQLPLTLAETQRTQSGSYFSVAHDALGTGMATDAAAAPVADGTSAVYGSATVCASSPQLEVAAVSASTAAGIPASVPAVLPSAQSASTSSSALSASVLLAPQSSSANDWEISRFNLIKVTTGTATWDAAINSGADQTAVNFNSNPGYDATGTDDLVRSNDEIIYQTSYYFDTVPNGNGSYTGTNVVHVAATLPGNVQGVATWDTAAMQWLENPTVSADGLTIEGDMTITGNSSANPLAPRTGTMNWVAQVGWAANGTKINTPAFTMAPAGKGTITASLLSSYANVNGQYVYVTAKGRYNAQLKNEGGDLYSVVLQFYSPTGGLKGQELPDTANSITVTLKSNWNQTYQDAKLNTTSAAGSSGVISAAQYGSNAPWDDGAATLTTTFNTVYNGGTVVGGGTAGSVDSAAVDNTITLTISNYAIDMTDTTGFGAGSDLVYADRNSSKTSLAQSVDYNDATIYNFGAYLFKVKTPSGYDAGVTGTKGLVSITGLSAKTQSGNTVGDSLLTDNTSTQMLYTGTSSGGAGGTYYTGFANQAAYGHGLWTQANGQRPASGIHSLDADGNRSSTVLNPNTYDSLSSASNKVTYSTVYPGQEFQVVTASDSSIYTSAITAYGLPMLNTVTNTPRYYTYFEKIDSDTFDVDERSAAEIGAWSTAGESLPVKFKYVARDGGWASDSALLDAHLDADAANMYNDAASSGSGLIVYDTVAGYRAAQASDPNLKLVGMVAEIECSQEAASKYGDSSHLTVGVAFPALVVKSDKVIDKNTNSLITDKSDPRLVAITTADMSLRTYNYQTHSTNSTVITRWSSSTSSALQFQYGNDVNPYPVSSNTLSYYSKAAFDASGNIATDASTQALVYGGNHYMYIANSGGYSWYVQAWGPYVTKGIAQTSGDTEKTTFNIDNGDRRVDYTVKSGITGSSIAKSTDTLTLTDVIPAGVNPVNPSSTDIAAKWGIAYADTGSTYTQDTTSYGGGSWSNDVSDALQTDAIKNLLTTYPNISYTLAETANADGSTTLTWKFSNFPVGYAAPDVHYSGILGNPDDSYDDLVNNTAETNTVTAATTTMPVSAASTKTITVLRQEVATATKTTDNEVRNDGDDVGFNINFDNEVEKQSDDDVSIVDVLSSTEAGNLDTGYTDPGNYILANAAVEGRNLSGATLKFFYATDASLAATGKTAASLTAVQAAYNAVGGAYTSASYAFPAADGWKELDLTVDAAGGIANGGAVQAALNGQHIVAVGLLASTMNIGSKLKLHYEYDWADVAVKAEMLKTGNFENTVAFFVNSTKQHGSNMSTSSPQVQLDKSLVSAPAAIGGVATYRVTATNYSSVYATNYAFVDTLTNASNITNIKAVDQNGNDVTNRVTYSNGVFTIGSIDSQVITGTAAKPGTVAVTFDVTTDSSKASFANYVEPVDKQGDWTLDKVRVAGEDSDVSSGDAVVEGNDIWYKLTIDNTNGTSAVSSASCATAETFQNLIYTGSSIGGTYGAGSVSSSTGTDGNVVVSWMPGNVAAGAKASVWLHFKVGSDSTLGSITNTATAGDRTKVVTDLTARISVAKVLATTSAAVGDTATYNITVTNTGTGTARNVAVPDGFTNLSYVSSAGNGVTYDASARAFGISSIAAGASVTITADYIIEATPFTNGAASPSNPPASTLSKVRVDASGNPVDPGSAVFVGETVYYRVTVANTSATAPLASQTVTDAAGPGLALLSTSAGSISSDAASLTWETGIIAAGGSAAITVTAKVTADAAGSVTNTASTPTDTVVVTDPVSVAGIVPSVVKVVSGDTPQSDSTFAFVMTNKGQSGVPLPQGASDGSAAVSRQGAGNVDFGPILYHVPGTYIYEITEAAGNEEGYTYDSTMYTMVVTVIDSGNGNLSAAYAIEYAADSSIVSGNTATFVNQYKAPTTAAIPKAGDDLLRWAYILIAATVMAGLVAVVLLYYRRRSKKRK
jgi:pilin isopeptide linkage protein/uncharacterized repeat protein (TIGR01451 family)